MGSRTRRGKSESYEEIVAYVLNENHKLLTTKEEYEVLLESKFASNIRLEFQCTCGKPFSQTFYFSSTDVELVVFQHQ